MKKIVNPLNGKTEYQLEAKMVTPLSETTLTNKNGKNYKLTTIEFADRNGELQRTSAAIYEGNYSKGVKQGETYLATARQADDGRIFIQMSHLPAAGSFATSDMFDSFEESATPTAKTTTAVIQGVLAD